MDTMEEFWETLLEVLNEMDVNNTERDPSQTQPETDILERVHDKLIAINPGLSFVVKPRIICMKDYDFGNPAYDKYLEKMMTVRYDFEITATGNTELFPLVDQIVSMADGYDVPDGWAVVRYCARVQGAEHNALIPNGPGTLISLSTMQYILQKNSDDTIHIALFLNADFVHNIKAQDDIDNLRNGVWLWLESLIGELQCATRVKAVTILPETELRNFMNVYNLVGSSKNGVYLIPELMDLFKSDSLCALCSIDSNHTTLTDHGSLLEYPYIKGSHCEYCFRLLKNFRPMYIKLRQI